jgi:hypothetical protein
LICNSFHKSGSTFVGRDPPTISDLESGEEDETSNHSEDHGFTVFSRAVRNQ